MAGPGEPHHTSSGIVRDMPFTIGVMINGSQPLEMIVLLESGSLSCILALSCEMGNRAAKYADIADGMCKDTGIWIVDLCDYGKVQMSPAKRNGSDSL